VLRSGCHHLPQQKWSPRVASSSSCRPYETPWPTTWERSSLSSRPIPTPTSYHRRRASEAHSRSTTPDVPFCEFSIRARMGQARNGDIVKQCRMGSAWDDIMEVRIMSTLKARCGLPVNTAFRPPASLPQTVSSPESHSQTSAGEVYRLGILSAGCSYLNRGHGTASWYCVVGLTSTTRRFRDRGRCVFGPLPVWRRWIRGMSWRHRSYVEGALLVSENNADRPPTPAHSGPWLNPRLHGLDSHSSPLPHPQLTASIGDQSWVP
jgi:hypothetical protein